MLDATCRGTVAQTWLFNEEGRTAGSIQYHQASRRTEICAGERVLHVRGKVISKHWMGFPTRLQYELLQGERQVAQAQTLWGVWLGKEYTIAHDGERLTLDVSRLSSVGHVRRGDQQIGTIRPKPGRKFFERTFQIDMPYAIPVTIRMFAFLLYLEQIDYS